MTGTPQVADDQLIVHHARQHRATSNKAISDPPSKATVHRTSTNRNLEGRIRHPEPNLQKSSSGKHIPETRPYELANATSKEYEHPEEEASLVVRKKGRVRGRSGSPESPSSNYKADTWSARDRESGQLSINAIRRDVGGQQHTFDKEFLREDLVPNKSLYDPTKDAVPIKGFGRDHDQDSGRAGPRSRPLLDESSPHGRLNPVNMEERQSQQSLAKDKIIQHVYGSLNEKATVKLERDRQSSTGASPPVDDWPADVPNAEPEMLLQPETRPISHDQLVIEVKGIYAGLVMVEAKCIDIDEKQMAAAQEKDLSKKIQLKNDQWQSLIALHKQVRADFRQEFPFKMQKGWPTNRTSVAIT